MTDDRDLRLLRVYCADFFGPQALQSDFKFSASGTYYIPEDTSLVSRDRHRSSVRLLPQCMRAQVFWEPGVLLVDLQNGFRNYVRDLSVIDPPEAFSQHVNAEISSQIADTDSLVSTLLLLQPPGTNTQSAGGTGSPEEQVKGILVLGNRHRKDCALSLRSAMPSCADHADKPP